MKLFRFVTILLPLLCASPLFADCAPKRLLKIVTAAEYPNAPADAFALKPKTVYRLGDRYSRVEEAPDPKRKMHLLIVANEPDIWVVNQIDNSGQHIVDPGPTFAVRLPVLDAVESKFWRQFEFGCEEPFMKAVGARVEQTATGETKYTHAAEEISVVLTVANGKPSRVDVAKKNTQFAVRYLEFEMLDETSTRMFARPENARFVEVKP